MFLYPARDNLTKGTSLESIIAKDCAPPRLTHLCPGEDYWADFYNFLHMDPSNDQMKKCHIFGPPAPSFAYNSHTVKNEVFPFQEFVISD